MGLKRSIALLALSSLLNFGCAMPKQVNPAPRPDECRLEEIVLNGEKFAACEQDISEKVIKGFELVSDVRHFAKSVLGMSESDNYMGYKSDRPGSEINWAYRLYVFPKTVISDDWKGTHMRADYKFMMPIKKPLFLFSHENALDGERDFYEGRGYDILYRKLSDYGRGADLTPAFLEKPIARQIEVLLHENWHATNAERFKHMSSAANENSATFIGYFGAVEFAERRYGNGSQVYRDAVKERDRYLRYSKTIVDLFNELSEVYGDEGWKEQEKLAIRSYLFKKAGEEENNAIVAFQYLYRRYYGAIYEVYKREGLAGTARILKETSADKLPK